MQKPLFYHFRPFILTSKIDQKSCLFKAVSWTSIFSLRKIKKVRFWDPLRNPMGSKMVPNRTSGAKMLKKYYGGYSFYAGLKQHAAQDTPEAPQDLIFDDFRIFQASFWRIINDSWRFFFLLWGHSNPSRHRCSAWGNHSQDKLGCYLAESMRPKPAQIIIRGRSADNRNKESWDWL